MSVNIFAQDDTTLSDHFSPSKQQCQKSLQYYMISLDYQNEGVVQSGIENIMKIKCHHSELNYGEVLSKLQQLAENAKSNERRGHPSIYWVIVERRAASYGKCDHH